MCGDVCISSVNFIYQREKKTLHFIDFIPCLFLSSPTVTEQQHHHQAFGNVAVSLLRWQRNCVALNVYNNRDKIGGWLMEYLMENLIHLRGCCSSVYTGMEQQLQLRLHSAKQDWVTDSVVIRRRSSAQAAVAAASLVDVSLSRLCLLIIMILPKVCSANRHRLRSRKWNDSRIERVALSTFKCAKTQDNDDDVIRSV